MKQKILVTGGTGYIGSHTAVEMMNRNYDVIIIDNLYNSDIKTVDAIRKITGRKPHFEKIDLCDARALGLFFRKNRNITAVIHFAAMKAVGESGSKPLEYYRNNTLSTIHLLQEMEKHSICNLVFSSSCTVYGQPDVNPVTEKTPLRSAVSVYGNTKKICEDIIRDKAKISSLKAISLRYFNPAGAHPSGLIGDSPVNPSDNLVPAMTLAADGKRKRLTVYGKDYPTPDGTAIRDYIHVTDLAAAHICAVERLVKNKKGGEYTAYNLGNGTGFSVLEVIRAFEKANGILLNYTIGPRRDGDVISVWADSTLAQKELGWKPHLGITDIVQSAWKREQFLNRTMK